MSRRRKAPKKSHVGVVLDCSGSMLTRALETKQGYDLMIEELRKEAKDTFVTLVEFDSTKSVVYEQKPLADVPALDYRTRGMTALLDGVGEAIRTIERFAKPGDNVAITIMTDGGENSSREWTKEAVTALMDEKRKEGWEFNFLGAGTDAWGGAQLLNIDHAHTINYSGSGHDHARVFRAMSVSNLEKTRGGTSSYLATAADIKTSLEANAAPAIDVDVTDVFSGVRRTRKSTRRR